MSYISQEDYKNLMNNFQKGSPKGLLKEELEKEGNAFTAGLAKTKKGGEFKVGGKEIKDTSNYDASMDESHEGIDKWYEDFENGLQNLVKNGYIHKNMYQYFHDALDHVDPMQNYGHMPAHDAAKEFVDDLRTKDQMDADDYQWKQEHGGYDGGGDDFNDGEFWEAEMKKLQEIAGVHSQDDGPEDDDEEAREKRAKKMEMDDEEAENAERDEMDEEVNPTKSYHGSTANQGDTGWTIDFTVIENTPEYFKIDYVMTPNSSNAPRGASRNYRPEKKYGEWKISKVGDKGQPLTDYEKTQLNIKGDHFGVNGKEFVQDIYGDKKTDMPGFGGTYDALDKLSIREETGENTNLRMPDKYAKLVAQKHSDDLKPLYDKYQAARKDPDHKVGNAAWKEYQNIAISWCGHEMLEQGKKRIEVSNILSGRGYWEDFNWEFMTALGEELKGMAKGLNEGSDYNKIIPALKAKGIKHAMPKKEIFKAIAEVMKELGFSDKEIRYDFGYDHDFLPDLLQALKDSEREMEEGLHMPPLQATGPTVDVNEDQAPFGMSVLSPDERDQLREYINHYRTIKSEISKLLEKSGKSGKIMENAKKIGDENVPAERKAKYHNPTEVPVQHKKSNLGGNRTGLVMTKAEMWENEEHEEGEHERIESMLDTKLHDAFHKVTGMIMKDLMADGFDEGDIKNFLQHEIDEKAKEAIDAQHDF